MSGTVYSYVLDGIRHYTTRPPAGATDVRAITYSFLETGKWALLYADDAVRVEADTSTALRSGTFVNLWTRLTYAHPKALTNAKTTRKYSRETRFEAYDCSARAVATKDYVRYDSAGEVVASAANLPYNAARVAPDTVGEATWQQVCQGDFVWNREGR